MRALALLASLSLLACAASGDDGGDPTGRRDAGGVDAFVPSADAGEPSDDDAGPAPADAGPAEDAAAPVDAGPLCEPEGDCDPFDAATCPEGRSCRPDETDFFRCTNHEAEPLGLGEACTTAASCAPGLLCLDFGDGLRCHPLCPEGGVGACPSGWECSGAFSGGSCVRVCREAPPRCDVYAQDCADPADGCAPTFDPETEEPITVCREAGPRAVGEECGGAAGRCAEGLVCVRSGDVNRCRQVCRPDGAPSCAGGEECIGTVSVWEITYCRAP